MDAEVTFLLWGRVMILGLPTSTAAGYSSCMPSVLQNSNTGCLAVMSVSFGGWDGTWFWFSLKINEQKYSITLLVQTSLELTHAAQVCSFRILGFPLSWSMCFCCNLPTCLPKLVTDCLSLMNAWLSFH